MKIPLRHLSFSALLALAVTACDGKGDPVEPEPEGPDITWLQQNAIPLATSEPGGPYTDLAPLGQMVAGARIVALGEATHGTREFFRMKHRVLEYLVKEQGFNTFAIEAGWAEVNRINHYVQTGEGDPVALVSLMHWIYNTAEVAEMVRWMRQHNQNPGGAPKVSFRGVDVSSSRLAMNDVVAYLRGVNGASADSVVGHYACYRAWSDTVGGFVQNYGGANAQQKEKCQQGVAAAYAQMATGATAYTAATGHDAYELALQTARVVVQSEHQRRDPEQRLARRDQNMAENAVWAAGPEGSGRKLVLWAHNGHVSNRQPWMGSHLAQTYGSGYRIVGFSFHRGPFSVILEGGPLSSATAPPAQADSYEHQFHRVGLPRFMLDLRPVRAGQAPGAAWLAGPMLMRVIGSVYDPAAPQSGSFPVWLTQEYDVLIHIEESTATQLLPYRSSQ
jgi:erythromycin esterase